jgi:biotin operon repressor
LNNSTNQKILSLFKDDETSASIQEIMDATGLSRRNASKRLVRLREKTGRKLPVTAMSIEESDNIILSFYEDGKPMPSATNIANALGITIAAANRRIQTLRKKVGRELPLTRKKPKIQN